MKWIVWIVLTLLAMSLASCQWAKFSEAWNGPAAGVSKAAPAAEGRFRYVPVGTGRWLDADGREHTETVYARVEAK